MKFHTPTSILLLAGASSALPMPRDSYPSVPEELSLPSPYKPTGLPSFPKPSSGFSLPSLPRPTGGLGLPSVPGGAGLPSLPKPDGGIGLPSLPSPSGGLGLPSLPKPSGGLGLPSLPGGAGLPSLPKPDSGLGLPSLPKPSGGGGAGSGIPSEIPGLGGSGSVPANAVPSLGGSTENGLESGSCGDMTVIFARGTGEMGNVGTISGPPMFKSLRAKLGNDKVVVQGVDYPASAAGNANLGAAGGPAMAQSVKAARSKCPNTKIILSGYSQGAMVVHNAFQQGVAASDVAGAVLFGDPLKTQKVGDLSDAKVQQFCGTSDSICGMGTSPSGGHLSYGSVADEAAAFAIKAAGLA